MKKIYLCGAHWCNPCQFIRKNMLKDIEEECPGQTEYIDIQKTPGALDKFKIFRIPQMCVMEDEEIIKCYSGKYPSKTVLIDWLKGKRNDLGDELFKPC